MAALIVTICFIASRAEAQSEHVDHLDLPTAETLALRHAPAIAREYFRTQAAKEVVKQVRSGLFPQLAGSVAAVGTGDDAGNVFGGSPITNVNPESRPVSTRLGAVGGLSDPTVFSRESNGVNLTQTRYRFWAHCESNRRVPFFRALTGTADRSGLALRCCCWWMNHIFE